MRLGWSSEALADLRRLHDFLAPANPTAAARAIDVLLAAPERLLEFPRLGERIQRYKSREVRRLLIGPYEVRYEIHPSRITILRLFHAREDR